MKRRLLSIIVILLQLLQISAAVAATQTMSASISFETALSLTNGTNVSFGFVKASQPGVYTISPSGAITATNDGVALGGDTHAGSMTIVGSETQNIDISVNHYVSNNGVTPSAATCSYNGGAAAPCALTSQPAPGAGKPLLLGVTLTVDGTQQTGTTAAPTFDVAVTYH